MEDPGPSPLRSSLELVAIVAGAVALALLVQAYAVKPFQIPTGSMIPTLEVDQRILVNRASYHFGGPSRGDVIVFNPPQDTRCAPGAERPDTPCARPYSEPAEENFVKRVVAVAGDRVSIQGGHPVVNGQIQADEPFTVPCGDGIGCNLGNEIEVPEDHVFVLGDNRGASDDSRFWGPVPEEWIIGKAFGSYWPPDRIGGV